MNGRSFIHKVMIGLWFTYTMPLAHAETPLWTITPLTQTTITVAANGTANVRYQVTNQSRKTHTLAMKAIHGVTQNTSLGNCSSSFVLGYQQSCILNLSIEGSALKKIINGGPVVCSQDNLNQCYQPSSANSLHILLREATDKTIGLWHETTPSSWKYPGDYETFLTGNGIDNLGFVAYAADYVNFVGKLQSTAQSNGFGLGPIYFQGGDPGASDWTSNNDFKYLMPNPAPGKRPMINQYVVEPLQKLGVRQFGLVVNLGSNSTPWVWQPNSEDPNPPEQLPPNVNENAISLFKLLYELNQELESSYSKQNILPDNQLYITLLGFDNEGVTVTETNCQSSPPVSSGTVMNGLWNFYVKSFNYSSAVPPQWGITGASPPFFDYCDQQGDDPIPASQRAFAFIEYYNVPGNNAAMYDFDHPGFVPCPSLWGGAIVSNTGVSCQCGESGQPACEVYYQLAYGVVTPSFSSQTVDNTTRTIDPATIYTTTPHPVWSDVWKGIWNSEVWNQRQAGNGILNQEFIEAAYSMLDQKTLPNDPLGNLTTLSQSNNYCNDAQCPVPGTQWMLSIENYSSSYRTLINPIINQLENIPIADVNTQSPFSSIALKYGPNAPFDIVNGQYVLSHPTNASGTFEAFGGWGVDNLVALMKYMSQQNPLLKNFMIYEYAFVQLNDAKPLSPYYTVGGNASGLSGGVMLQDMGANDLLVDSNGPFTFATPVAQGEPYSVTVLTQPTGQTCSVTNGSGTMGAANVINVAVSCVTN